MPDRSVQPDATRQADRTAQTDSARSEISRLAASGDLLDVARQMRQMGVESLLFARPDGRITRVVTDRQIAHLAGIVPARPAAWPAEATATSSRPPAPPGVSTSAVSDRVVPEQGLSLDRDVLDRNVVEADPTVAGVSRR